MKLGSTKRCATYINTWHARMKHCPIRNEKHAVEERRRPKPEAYEVIVPENCSERFVSVQVKTH